jgi:hypothetical protein
LTFLQTGFDEPVPGPSFCTPPRDEAVAAERSCGWMTLPAWGSCGADGAEVAAEGAGGITFGPEGEVATGGVTDEGRDHPGPVVEDDFKLVVNFVVTRRE